MRSGELEVAARDIEWAVAMGRQGRRAMWGKSSHTMRRAPELAHADRHHHLCRRHDGGGAGLSGR